MIKSNNNKSLFCFLLLILISISGHTQSLPVYSIKVDSIANNKEMNFSSFQGKKILIVNATMFDIKYFEWTELKKLQQQYNNKLVVAVWPSIVYNNKMVVDIFQRNNFPFVVASNQGTGINSNIQLYDWLEKKSLNGLQDTYVRIGFQKYLLNENRKLIAVFEPKVRPISKIIMDGIEVSVN